MGLSSGVYSLIGVVVGGFTTGSVQYIFAARTEHGQERASRRLLAESLAHCAVAHDGLFAHDGPQVGVYLERLREDQGLWKEHARQLAVMLNDEDWFAIALAFRAIEQDLESHSLSATGGPVLRTLDLDIAETRAEMILGGLRVLDPDAAEGVQAFRADPEG